MRELMGLSSDMSYPCSISISEQTLKKGVFRMTLAPDGQTLHKVTAAVCLWEGSLTS